MAAMQFWGVEVKGNKPCKVKVEEDHVIHLSQATLGELKKDSEPVTVHVKVDDKKLVLGILNSGNNPQLAFDLVFDTDFEISHNWKNGSVHFLGYQSEMPKAGTTDEELSDFSSDEEDVPIPRKENGKPAAAVTIAAPKAAAKPNKDNKPKPEKESEDESDEDEEDSDDDSEGAEDMSMGDASDDDEDDSDDDEGSSDEEPAKPAESGKKRPNAEAKTPQTKKAKLATPQKTDGKKGGHDATPHPSKKVGKTPGSDKSPKSGGQVSCGSCKKAFNSENALQSHTKAKHAGK